MSGKNLENIILDQLKKISEREQGFFIKSPTPIKNININGKYKMIYSEKALCDFVGILNKKFILIEAKEVSGNRFDFRRLKDHQIKQLSSIQKYGGISIIVFHIKMIDKIVIVKIVDYLLYLNSTNKKSINIDTLLKIGKSIDINHLEKTLLMF